MSGGPSETDVLGAVLGSGAPLPPISGGTAGPSESGQETGHVQTAFGSAFSVGAGSTATSTPSLNAGAAAGDNNSLLLMLAGGALLLVLALRR